MRPTLRLEELSALLKLLGIDEKNPLAPLLPKLRDLTVSTRPHLGTVSARYRYCLRIDTTSPSDEPLLWVLVQRATELLDAWSAGDAVSVDVEINGANSELGS
jgi:hypothetical protein